jgi:hypothetical protein
MRQLPDMKAARDVLDEIARIRAHSQEKVSRISLD